MKKKLFTCIICTFAFACTPFIAHISNTEKVFAVDSAFSSVFLEISNVKEVTSATNLSNIRIKDESRVVTQKDTIYSIKLDNGFVFQNKPEIFTSGKYKDNIFFEIDYQNNSIAYITVQKKTDASDGMIEFQNLEIAPTRNSEINKDITLSLSGDNTYDTIKVGVYKEPPASYRQNIVIQTLEGGKKPSATGTAAANRKLQIHIDKEEYGNIIVGEDGTWNYVFPYKYSSLQAGTHTFTVGYLQGTDTLFSAVSKEFEIEEEAPKTTATVTFTVDDTSYTYDGKKGYMESPPFIDSNGRVQLPLRAVAATFGIDSQDIQWNGENQTIHITMNDKSIIYEIGSNIATINTDTFEMDTAPIIKDGVTFLPLRPLLNSLGITDDNIQWNANTHTVSYEVERANS